MTGGLFAGAAVLFVVAAVASGAWYWWVLAGTFAVLAVITVMSARRDRQS
jgi:membrane protein implicated in regulation of membrane protease activity